jgi:hypothetical protein
MQRNKGMRDSAALYRGEGSRLGRLKLLKLTYELGKPVIQKQLRYDTGGDEIESAINSRRQCIPFAGSHCLNFQGVMPDLTRVAKLANRAVIREAEEFLTRQPWHRYQSGPFCLGHDRVEIAGRHDLVKVNGIWGATGIPYGRSPSVSDILMSLSLHLPMPVSGSGVMFEPLTVYAGSSQFWELPRSASP